MAENKGAPWTRQDEQFIEEHATLGWSDLRIATALGRTKDSVVRKRSLMGVVNPNGKKPNWSKEEDERLTALVSQGKTDKAIARAMKRTLLAVTSRRRMLKLPRWDAYQAGIARSLCWTCKNAYVWKCQWINDAERSDDMTIKNGMVVKCELYTREEEDECEPIKISAESITNAW